MTWAGYGLGQIGYYGAAGTAVKASKVQIPEIASFNTEIAPEAPAGRSGGSPQARVSTKLINAEIPAKDFPIVKELPILLPTQRESIALGVSEHLDIEPSIFPNPSKDILNIVPGSDFESGILTIHDNLGRLIYESTNLIQNVIIEVSSWPSGMYYIKLSNANKTKSIKFIKLNQ